MAYNFWFVRKICIACCAPFSCSVEQQDRTRCIHAKAKTDGGYDYKRRSRCPLLHMQGIDPSEATCPARWGRLLPSI